jgi:hypothetical protein
MQNQKREAEQLKVDRRFQQRNQAGRLPTALSKGATADAAFRRNHLPGPPEKFSRERPERPPEGRLQYRRHPRSRL